MKKLRARWVAMPGNLRGIILVAISGVLFASLNVATIFPAQELNSYMMAFCRYLFGSLFLLPIFLRRGLVTPFRTRRIGLHALRGALHSGGMQLWFVALPLITLADLTALGFTDRSSSPSAPRCSSERTCACGAGRRSASASSAP